MARKSSGSGLPAKGPATRKRTTAASTRASTTTNKASKTAADTTSKKRKPRDYEAGSESEHEQQRPAGDKRQKPSDGVPVKLKPSRQETKKAKITIQNDAPTRLLDVYVFGANSCGELGMGAEYDEWECSRPTLNPLLSGAAVGVVQIATGGMHCAALTHDNEILTWGVNDNGALGRDTTSEDKQSEDLNRKECTPTAIDTSGIAAGTRFTQVAAADSATFALTEDGLVYGWGTFKEGNGGKSFSPTVKVQSTATLIPGLEKVTKLVTGTNHVLALTSNGTIFGWGVGEYSQLGREIIEQHKEKALLPKVVTRRKGFVDIACGSEHCYAVHKDGKVYGWGLNNYGQTGISSGAGETKAIVPRPREIVGLQSCGNIACIDGGGFHGLAVTDQGECLVWGRIDNFATGLDVSTLPESDILRDDRDKPRILKTPTPVPDVEAVFAAAGSEHNIAITRDGKAYSWGFNDSYRTGIPSDDDIQVARLIKSASVRDLRLVWAGASGRYGMVATEYSSALPNGIS
ncbi:hypothetical protein AJ80_01792 [Polytolypa hystricis UAMH7299]|uniref:RCC1-like domain-containing protein n=1 Tax=Polytolypa hystricis (strain UAMH7299) TaxID=1447883 RepID=A0A2B7Z022_POLH7|nr:hypothetical protein AJ80_01792 [Polytolypa hystricis UAMH7299]